MPGLIKENTFGHCVKTKDNIPFKIKRYKQKSEQQKKILLIMYRALNRMQLCKWIPVPWQQYWDEVYQLLLLITLRGTYSILLYFILDQLFIVVKTLYICWMLNAHKFSEVTLCKLHGLFQRLCRVCELLCSANRLTPFISLFISISLCLLNRMPQQSWYWLF